MAIMLEDLLKKDNATQTLGTTPVVAKMDTMQYIDNFLTKVVRIMELGNSMIANGMKLKESVGGSMQKSNAIQQMESKILGDKAVETRTV